ncbi:hypothetical protein JJD41_01405 [Oxynema sp. CENA135]|uniref:hypothetical protein n=1 Tax=Oxynema sp. CENA135 TaxID=984206 RepID=UPI00190A730B|nr:hypothetical protein [Oxynema sp. CENA135]MBK4728547.1 hypothetical protein [Oxynema sp. CENA135]
MSSLKDRIENNLVVFTLSTLLAGFTAGFGAYHTILTLSGNRSLSDTQVEHLRQELRSQYCDSSYPDFCIPPYQTDLDCEHLPFQNIRVIGSDPHNLDGDRDGIGCESPSSDLKDGES